MTKVKVQIHTLLKKFGIQKPEELNNWTKVFRGWLTEVSEKMGLGFQTNMSSLMRQLEFLEKEQYKLRRAILALSAQERYRDQCEELLKIRGVGLITAMTFLTEIGDVERFSNRRQVGAFMGLVPSSFESGEINDRKGRITRDGPYRIRSVLNQALWIHLKYHGEEKATYERIVAKNPKRKKKAVVACMRRLGIRMWHTAMDVAMAKKIRIAA
ncbi:MAG: transposase [Candidatus Thorarchaeota archaeon]